ncbi:hypothetical protein C8E84_0569 [Ornithinibacter aureus]|nr:hypothetical protein C8E84_0569 [Ornithinibacter aureus]
MIRKRCQAQSDRQGATPIINIMSFRSLRIASAETLRSVWPTTPRALELRFAFSRIAATKAFLGPGGVLGHADKRDYQHVTLTLSWRLNVSRAPLKTLSLLHADKPAEPWARYAGRSAWWAGPQHDGVVRDEVGRPQRPRGATGRVPTKQPRLSQRALTFRSSDVGRGTDGSCWSTWTAEGWPEPVDSIFNGIEGSTIDATKALTASGAKRHNTLRAGQPGTRNWTSQQRADILAGRRPQFNGETIEGPSHAQRAGSPAYRRQCEQYLSRHLE